jgi:hypothetical protein
MGTVVPGLADAFRVITPDSRGHGRSTGPSERLSYGLIADDTAALIDALVLPAGVDRAAACRGRVSLRFRLGGRTVALRRMAVRRNCRFGTRIVAKRGTRLARAARLRVGARFGGNGVLDGARASVSRRLR